MVVVLAVLATIVALIVPTLAGLVQADRERTTQAQVERVWRAIYGDPAKGEFGYLGDMGRLPAGLPELLDVGAQKPYHTEDGGTAHVGNLGFGWRGPYLRDFFATTDLLSDAWGRPLTFSNGQVISGGPDGDAATTGDNIVFPVHAPPRTGTLFVSVLANRIPDPLGAAVKLYSPLNGEQTGSATQKHLPQTAFDGFVFEDVAHGLHALKVTHIGENPDTKECVTVTRVIVIAVHAGAQVVREVRMTTSADVKVTENPCTPVNITP